MNKPQKFMVFLWGLTVLLCIGLIATGGAAAAGFYFVGGSVIFGGLFWVFADKKKTD